MDLEGAIDELYGASLEDFVSERTRLAKELREAGSREQAEAVAKLRKPTTAAWVLNQLARRNRRDVDLLLDAGHRLRQAQAGVVRGGKRESFEQARQTEADALRRLGREAEKLLRSARGNASDAVLKQIVQGLRAAAVSDEAREELARGTFVRPPDETSGFGLLSELVGELPPPSPAKQRRDEDRRAKAELRETRKRLREAERELRTAEAEQRSAERDVQAAAGRADTARQEIE